MPEQALALKCSVRSRLVCSWHASMKQHTGVTVPAKMCPSSLFVWIGRQSPWKRHHSLTGPCACARVQIAVTMYKMPGVFLRDAARDLLPTYEYLRSLGLADEDLTGILRACASLAASARHHLVAVSRHQQDWSLLRHSAQH